MVEVDVAGDTGALSGKQPLQDYDQALDGGEVRQALGQLGSFRLVRIIVALDAVSPGCHIFTPCPVRFYLA